MYLMKLALQRPYSVAMISAYLTNDLVSFTRVFQVLSLLRATSCSFALVLVSAACLLPLRLPIQYESQRSLSEPLSSYSTSAVLFSFSCANCQ